MAINSRSLRLESVEDRVVPSMTIVSMGLYGPIYGTTYAFQDRGESTGRFDDSFQAGRNDNSFHSDFGFDRQFAGQPDAFVATPLFGQAVVIAVVNWGSDWNSSISVSPSPAPAPMPTQLTTSNPTSPGDDATTGSSDAAASALNAFAGRTASHGTTISTGDAATDKALASGNTNISAAGSSPSVPAGQANYATSVAAQAAARQIAPIAQPAAFETHPEFGHLTVPVLAFVEVPTSQPAEAAPMIPQSEEPPTAPGEPPAAMPESGPTPSEAPPTIATGDPTPGLFPFNLSGIESGVRGVLDRVAGLEQTLAANSAGAEDYLWLAAATLVAGGVAQTAWTRRIRSADPRTLGLDSVLARWGERNVG